MSGSRAVPSLCCISDADFVAENAPHAFATEEKGAQKALSKSQDTIPGNENALKELYYLCYSGNVRQDGSVYYIFINGLLHLHT